MLVTSAAPTRARDLKRLRPRRPCAPPDALAYTVPDACLLAGFGRTTCYGLVQVGKLRLIKIGRRSLIAGDSLRAFLGAGV